MHQTQSEIKIRQLHYFKTPPQSSVETNRSTHNLKVLEHKLGRTKFSTNYTMDTRPFFENFMEKTDHIQSFGYKLPFIVPQHENPNAQIHFLEVFTHSQTLVESYIAEQRKTINALKQESDAIKNEMNMMKQRVESDLQTQEARCRAFILDKEKILKADYVRYATESYAKNKEVAKLLKEKMQLELDALQALAKISRLERTLQGVEMEIEVEDEAGLTAQLKGTFTNTHMITH